MPTFYPLFPNVSLLLPFLVSENPEETPNPLKKILIFAPFQPILSRFALLSGPQAVRLPSSAQVLPECSHSPEMPRWVRVLSVLHYQAGCRNNNPTRTEEHKRTTCTTNKASRQGTRERAGTKKGKGNEERKKGEGKGTEREAHKPTKKGTPPPYCKEQAAFPLITNSRQKISKKSLGVDLKKFSEKFFVGMFRGKEKPLALSQRKGVLTNENREISNLAMQITKNAQKH